MGPVSPLPHLGGLAYRLGELRPVTDPTGADEAADAAELLVSRGVRTYARFADDPFALLPDCVAESLDLARTRPDEIDAVLLVTESYADLFTGPVLRGETAFRAGRNRLIDAINAAGMTRAALFSATYGGSCNVVQALFLARALVTAGAVNRVLLVCADRHPQSVARFMEQAIAMTGDALAVCVLADGPALGDATYRVDHVGLSRYRPVAAADDLGRLVLEMYRATKSAAADCYEALDLQPADYGWLVFNNYNDATTDVFATLLGFPRERAFRGNAARVGHIPSCDLLVNLADLQRAEPVLGGQHVLMYANGPVSCGTVSLTRVPDSAGQR